VIVLDTIVLSEPLKTRPDERVLAWLGSVDDVVRVTAVTVGELLVGVRRLASGRRRDELLTVIEDTLTRFSGSVLAYDELAARRYASMQETRRLAGRPLSVEDGMIAAICAAHDGRLATRNLSDFQGLGIDLVDPWAVRD
jgi:predicted nucleic acid-binding protein